MCTYMPREWTTHPCALYTLQCIHNTHTEQRDFTPVQRQLTLSSGGHCENIAIVNDSILETDETFTVTISSSDPGVLVAKGEITLTIQDDDCK